MFPVGKEFRLNDASYSLGLFKRGQELRNGAFSWLNPVDSAVVTGKDDTVELPIQAGHDSGISSDGPRSTAGKGKHFYVSITGGECELCSVRRKGKAGEGFFTVRYSLELCICRVFPK